MGIDSEMERPNSPHLDIIRNSVPHSGSVSSCLAEPESTNDGEIRISRVSNGKKRVWDKVYTCVYCEKKYAKLPRHLTSCHQDEIEVIRASAFKIGSSERNTALATIRKKGMHSHNMKVMQSGTGELQVTRRPLAVVQSVKFDDFAVCDWCKGAYKRSDIWRHRKRCKPYDQNFSSSSSVSKTKSSATSLQLSLVVNEEQYPESFTDLLRGMRQDNIGVECVRDLTIKNYGLNKFKKHGHDITKHNYIRGKMRELARFTITARENGFTSLLNVIKPANFPQVESMIKKLTGFNSESGSYTNPSLALKLCQSIKKCAVNLKIEYMIKEDDNMTDRFRKFEELCSTWKDSVSGLALTTLYENKFIKPKLLPYLMTSALLHRHLDNEMSRLMDELQKGVNCWTDLSLVLLAVVTLFNRRRSGEVGKMDLKFYTNRADDTSDDILQSLTALERRLCDELTRIVIRGKRGRAVPVLFTKRMKSCADLLLKHRAVAGIHENNISSSRGRHLLYCICEDRTHLQSSPRQAVQNDPIY